MKKISLYVLLFGIGYIFYSALVIINYASKSNNDSSDIAIVLGNAIIGDQPSLVFRERIEHGITLYKKGIVKQLIFTGGVGKGEILTEAEVAQVYAIKSGVKSIDIFTERSSTITYENLIEAKKIIDQNNMNSILIVSDPLHMKRAMSMATDIGLNAKPAPTSTSQYKTWSAKFWFLMKEISFYNYYLFYKVFMSF